VTWPTLLVFSLIAYLVGAIPFSWIFVRLIKGIDLRTVGSGNLGSTNAMRVLGVPLGLTIQALDILKGWAPVFVLTCNGGRTPIAPVSALLEAQGRSAAVALDHAALVIGLAAVVGHIFPVYLRFRGGKGVNTSLGVFIALAPKALLVAAAVGIAVLAAFRYVSLCSMTGAVLFPVAVCYFYPDRSALIAVAALTAILVVAMHRSNIKRLLAGTEPRLGKRIAREEASGREAGKPPA